MKFLKRHVICVCFLTVVGCSDRLLSIKEQRVDFGADLIELAVKDFSQKGSTPEAYEQFVNSLEGVKSQFNLETSAEADYWRVVLATPLMHALVDEPFAAQAEALGQNVWPYWLNAKKDPSESMHQAFENYCSGNLAHKCRHLVPEVWPAVFSLAAWQHLEEKAKEVFDACLDCDGVHDTKAIEEEIKRDVKSIEAKNLAAIEEGSPFLWPRAFEGLSDFDGLKTQFKCDEKNRCVPMGNTAAKLKASSTLALHVGPDVSMGNLKKMMKALHGTYGTGVELFLLFRDKEFPYKLKEMPLEHESRLTKGLRIEDEDSLQLWVQGKAAQN